MIRNIAGNALTASAGFFAVVAVMLNSPGLFYMATALLAMIGGSRLQAYYSVRGLRFERTASESVTVGDPVRVEITVWSRWRLKRPLLTIRDALPPRLVFSDRSYSMPIAPAPDQPVQTHYSFIPLRRGVFRWSGIQVVGTDALGIVAISRDYRTETTELIVLPRPIPVSVDLPTAAGWGISEAESGQSRGAGLEPRGIRQYQTGDSLRHVHWRSSARAGQLLVKEFEAGSHATVAFLLQLTDGTEVGSGGETTFEIMCGHLMYLAANFLRQGARVELPQFEIKPVTGSIEERLDLIAGALAHASPERTNSYAEELQSSIRKLVAGSALFPMIAIADPELPLAAGGSGHVKVVPLVYNAASFGKLRASQRSAADPSYLGELESAGMFPVMMPSYGEI